MTGRAIQRAAFKTNDTPGSVCRIDVEPVRFADLWKGYPGSAPYLDPKTEKPPPGYSNQCALKVSASIHSVGIDMKSYVYSDRVKMNGKNAAALATNLANWLKQMPFCGLPKTPENITGEKWEGRIRGRTGIVYFADYWKRSTDKEGQPTGDHIDLWNGARLTASGFLGTLTTTARYLGRRSFLPGTDWGYSDLGTSKGILFWEIK